MATQLRAPILGLTLILMAAIALPKVPRVWLDYSTLPLLHAIPQPDNWGTDTIADMYAARVVLNDPRDMYTKAKVEQTPLEAVTWSKEASAPYPPVALFVMAGLSAVGDVLGIGYYGMVLVLAAVFIGLSLAYFAQTRWFLFPLLYLNFSYLAERFVFVQDGSYLAMLVVIMTALWLARGGHASSHLLMAVATTMKLSPLYYLRHVAGMARPIGLAYLTIVAVGLALPYFVFEDYLSIYTYGFELRGSTAGAMGALAAAAVFALLIAYVEVRRGFDWEERIGWALVPVAVFLALKLNAPRHLLLVLLVPDKRGLRNIAAAIALLLPAVLPSVVRFGSAGPVAAIILLGGLLWYLRQIGWTTVGDDLRHPMRTARMLAREPGASS